jgi:hypothetical protein
VVRIFGARVVLRWVIDDQRPPTAAAGVSPVEAAALAARLLAGLRTKLGGTHIRPRPAGRCRGARSGGHSALAAALLPDLLERS